MKSPNKTDAKIDKTIRLSIIFFIPLQKVTEFKNK